MTDGSLLAEVLEGLPPEWETATLGDLFTIQQGKALSRANSAARGGVSRSFLRTANVLWGRIDLSTRDTMPFTDVEAEKLELRDGDLLVCEGGDIGRTAMWRSSADGCYYQNHLHRLRATRPGIDPAFFMYWMEFAVRLRNLYEGAGNRTTIPNLSKGRLASFRVPLPPLPEQRAIARALAAVQRAKEAGARVVAAARQIKESMRSHLFEFGPVPISEADRVTRMESEIGMIPRHWDIALLHEVASMFQYGLSVRGEREGAVPMLRMNCISDGRVDTRDLQFVTLDSASAERFALRNGDVLFNRTNSAERVGRLALFEETGMFTFASYLVRVRTDPSKLDPAFLNFYANGPATQRRLKEMASRGVSQSNISAGKLRALPVVVPPLGEQRACVAALRTVERRIDSDESRVAALDALFRSLLDALMTGKLRVPESMLAEEATA